MANERSVSKVGATGTEADVGEPMDVEAKRISTKKKETMSSEVHDSALDCKTEVLGTSVSTALDRAGIMRPLIPSQEIALLEMQYIELLEKKVARLKAEEHGDELLDSGTENYEEEHKVSLHMAQIVFN